MWPYCDRKVQFFASLNGERVKFVICDEGPGFNYQKVLDPTADEQIDRVGGRGLLLIRSFMDEVSYNRRGNEITLQKYTSAGRKLLAKMGEQSRDPANVGLEVSGEVILPDDDPEEILEFVGAT